MLLLTVHWLIWLRVSRVGVDTSGMRDNSMTNTTSINWNTHLVMPAWTWISKLDFVTWCAYSWTLRQLSLSISIDAIGKSKCVWELAVAVKLIFLGKYNCLPCIAIHICCFLSLLSILRPKQFIDLLSCINAVGSTIFDSVL